MSADTYKAKLAIETLRKYLADDAIADRNDHSPAPVEAVTDLIETYEWLLERREHLALDHDALKREHETMTDWKSEQVGALMIAATEAIDTVERIANAKDDFYDYEGLTARLATWRAAVSRTNPAPIGAGDGAS